MEVLGLPNGICAVGDRRGVAHGPKMSVNGEPVCLKCRSIAEQAGRTSILVNVAKDPGHDGMKGIVAGGPEKTIVQVPVVNGQAGEAPQAAEKRYVGVPVAVESKLAIIKAAIYGLPMPKSMAQYKRFLKIQQLIDQCLSEEENG